MCLHLSMHPLHTSMVNLEPSAGALHHAVDSCLVRIAGTCGASPQNSGVEESKRIDAQHLDRQPSHHIDEPQSTPTIYSLVRVISSP